MIRKATEKDIARISEIYDLIHDEIEAGRIEIGWIRGVYPTRETAEAALERGDLFVMEEEPAAREEGRVIAAAVINQIQVPVYEEAAWKHQAEDDKVMVLHTLVVDPKLTGKGYGLAFVEFYERYALEHGCRELRFDTNAVNARAREIYRRLGYEEVSILPCEFNGIPGVNLVCLEKYKDVSDLGFGFLRLPKSEDGKDLDWPAIDRMADAYMEAGGVYFDTCYTYLEGLSEEAVRRSVVLRKDRNTFKVVDKLPGYMCRTPEDIAKYYEEEKRRCGVEYFDIMMLHSLNKEYYDIAERLDQFSFVKELKEKGLVGRLGFSYHDSPELLDEILTKHPEMDVVLMQINYLDWDSPGICSRGCYETAVRHGKSVFVMEPVKGGTLSKLPEEAEAMLREMHPYWTPSDWALRFVRSLPGVEICLSGMNHLSQIRANMAPFDPLTKAEKALLARVAEILRSKGGIPCTGCGYCVSQCPMDIAIPEYFGMYNDLDRIPGDDWKVMPVYEHTVLTRGRASDCIACGSCAARCPQRIDIPGWMTKVSERFDK